MEYIENKLSNKTTRINDLIIGPDYCRVTEEEEEKNNCEKEEEEEEEED